MIPPAPPKNNTGLIVAVVAVLILLLVVGGGGGAWWLLSRNDDSSSTSAGGSSSTSGGESPTVTEKDPATDKELAAENLAAMYQSLADGSVEGYCDGIAVGVDYIVSSKSECLKDFETWLESDVADTWQDLRREISVSDLYETGDGTLTIRDKDLFVESTEMYRILVSDDLYDVTVLRYDSSAGRWKIIGWQWTDNDGEVAEQGVVPRAAKDLAEKGV